MFLDASALVAMATDEPESGAMAEAVASASARLTSGIAIFEAVLAVRRKRGHTIDQAGVFLRRLLQILAIEVVPLDQHDGFAALDAFSRYGNGQGHPAQLNLGDCFAYAMAKNRGLPLLFKGEDFARTDIVPAL